MKGLSTLVPQLHGRAKHAAIPAWLRLPCSRAHRPLSPRPPLSRCLAGFEPDPGRAAAMHRCRVQLLEGLSGALNPQHYPGLSRSIDLELAHVWREVADIREAQGGAQQAKVRPGWGWAGGWVGGVVPGWCSAGEGGGCLCSDWRPLCGGVPGGVGSATHFRRCTCLPPRGGRLRTQ